MKIAFIGARGIPHGYSSAEQLSLQVGKRLVARGHEYTVYCRSNLFEDKSPYYEGIRRLFLPTIEHKIFGQFAHGLLSGIHSVSRDFDIVHFQCLTNTYQSIIPWLIKRNAVVNVNGQEWDNPKWPRPLRHLFFKSAIYLTLWMQENFITDAVGMYQIYLERYGRKSTIIEYGAEIVVPQKPDVLKHYGLAPNEYYFVAARIVPSNQIDKIVYAFKNSLSKKMLAIAGGGAYGSEFYEELRRKAGDRVRFLGMISNQGHINELYANAYGYIHGASLGGINSALLRPLGAGCPALAYETPFNREVLEIEPGRLCGRIWRDPSELEEGIKFFDKNPQKIKEYSRLSVTQIKRKFNWDLVADQYETFYKGILEKWAPEKLQREVAAQKEKYASLGQPN
jgi:glycosyltransferase involved in cell wall biosynthesis